MGIVTSTSSSKKCKVHRDAQSHIPFEKGGKKKMQNENDDVEKKLMLKEDVCESLKWQKWVMKDTHTVYTLHVADRLQIIVFT